MHEDPFAELELAAQQQAAEERARDAVGRARVKLVLNRDAKSVFFASLALRLQPVVNWECETAATNGRQLIYSPEFINHLAPEQLTGLLAHEVMHCAMGHHSRRNDRDAKRWNVACDLAINPLLKDAGFQLPKGGLFPGQAPYADLPSGLSAEDYYSRLPQDEEQSDDPGQCGGVRDAGDQADQQTSGAEWQVAVAQASQAAKERGELPGGLGRLVRDIVEPEVDWQDILREFLSRSLTARDDYSWTVPNRRFIANGLYLPSLRSASLGHVVIAIDTSGSIDESQLASFAGELNGILDCSPCQASIVYCDHKVQRVDEWEPSDGPLTLDPIGGGGTSHVPVWDWLKQADIDTACVVALTDGATRFGDDPGVPVLWALTGDASPPFGRVLQIN